MSTLSTTTMIELEIAQNSQPQEITVGGNGETYAVFSFFSDHWQKLVALALWALIIATYLGYASTNGLTPWGAVEELIALMQKSYFGPLLFLAIFAIRPLIFFSAVLLAIAGGFLFGPVWGAVYTVIGSNASAMIAFVIGRYLGDGLISTGDDSNGDSSGDSNGVVQRYAKRMQANSFESVLIMRFVFLPYDLVNYLGGLLRLDWKAFLLATAIGSMPGIISFTLFGASVDSLDGGMPTVDWTTLTVGVALLAISLFISRYIKNREQ